MGVTLSEALTRALPTDETEMEQRLVEAAAASGLDRAEVDGLLQADTRMLPDEGALTSLMEAVGVERPADVLRSARQSGDWLIGDELPESGGIDQGARIVEAVGEGALVQGKPTRRYKVVVIRPGRAAGPGRRYYGTRMLESNAGNFGGQPVFFNHEDMATILRRGHGSRDPRDLAGFLLESTSFDPNYSEPDDAAKGRRQGAVMGEVDFLLEAADLVDSLPGALAMSVCMDPTKIKVGRTEEGTIAPLVEGVVKRSGSLDLITGNAGAGGRVLERLQEAAEAGYGPAHADPADLDDAALVEAVRSRPGALAALTDPDQEPSPVKITAEDLREVLQSEEGQALVTPLIEAQVSARETEIREEAAADAQRRLDLRDFRDEAVRLVESSVLLSAYPTFGESVRERYALRDGVPAAALDIYDDVDAEGKVTKAAIERLRESVAADIQREEAKLREANPTLVRGLGGQTDEEERANRQRLVEAGEGGEGGEGGEPEPTIAESNASRFGVDPKAVRRHQGRR